MSSLVVSIDVIALDLVSEAEHAGLVLRDKRLAVGLGVLGVGEEHALVALGLFVLANAAGLSQWSVSMLIVWIY